MLKNSFPAEQESCVKKGGVQRSGLAEVRELVFRPPVTTDDWKIKIEDNNK